MSVSCYEMCALESKLSKFIFPGLVPLSSTRRQLRKMATSGEHKSLCVLDFHVNKTVVSVQRYFRTKFGTDLPSDKSFRKWLHLQTKIDWKSVDRPQWTIATTMDRPCSCGGSRTDALATTFPRCHPRVISSCEASSRIVFLHHHFQRRWLTCARASQQPSQWLTTTCYRESDRNLIAGLMCAVLRVEHMLNIRNVPEKM
jgi:hypothetical protein